MGVTITTPAVGAPIGATYVTLSNNPTLTAERVLTAGEGIDITDAGANLTVTISGEDATITNKGIASFNTNNFSVVGGAVSLGTQGVDLDMGGNNLDDVDNLYVKDIYHPTGGIIDFYDSINMGTNSIWNGGVLQGTTLNINITSANNYINDDLYMGGDIDMNGNQILDGGISYFVSLFPSGGSGTGAVGSSGLKWGAVYCVVLHEGDHVFAEKTCPLCDKKFKAGESIVNYVLSNTEEGTRTIPVHLTCAIKPENQTKKKHGEVIQKLKQAGRYIDPIKEMAKMKEIEAKLKAKRDAKLKV